MADIHGKLLPRLAYFAAPSGVTFELTPQLRAIALNSRDLAFQDLSFPHNNTTDSTTANMNNESEASLTTSPAPTMVTLKNEEPVDQGDVFTLFPKLPPELPNKIWKNACFVSRAVDIWQVPVGENDFGKACLKAFRNRIWVYKSHSRTPSILHTSMEARSVGLEHYELSFGTKITAKIGPTEIDISIPPRIYVHFDCDMICPIPTSLIKPGKPYGQDSIFFILGCLKNAPMTQRLALPDYWVDDMCCSLIIERFVVKEILVYRGFLHRFRPFEIRILISLKLEDTHGELEEGELGLLAIVDDTKKFFGYRRTDEAIKTWGKIPGDGSHRFSRPRV